MSAVVAAPAATAADGELRGQWHLDQAPRAPLPAAGELVSAELWGRAVEQFERAVLRRKLGDTDPRGLQDFIVEQPAAAILHDLADGAELLLTPAARLVERAPEPLSR